MQNLPRSAVGKEKLLAARRAMVLARTTLQKAILRKLSLSKTDHRKKPLRLVSLATQARRSGTISVVASTGATT
jgi:hypothetical protein